MANSTKTEVKARDLHYYRRRYQNRVFARLAAFFAEEAQRNGITKKDIADRLKKDPAQISRWLSAPSNLTLDTVSDLLLAVGAEADPPIIWRFVDRPKPNYQHPWLTAITGDTNIKAPEPETKATSKDVVKKEFKRVMDDNIEVTLQ